MLSSFIYAGKYSDLQTWSVSFVISGHEIIHFNMNKIKIPNVGWYEI